jgi:polyisoprenoid-binding protein YceI
MKKMCFSLCLLSSFAFGVEKLDLKTAKTELKFTATGSLGLTIEGEAEKSLAGELFLSEGKLTTKATAQMSLFKTGIALRDRHLKEKYLEVERFPEATLEFTNVAVPLAEKSKHLPWEGSLTLHGVTKKVSGVFDLERKGKDIDLDFKFSVKLSEFGIAQPEFLNVQVKDDVSVEVDIEGTVGESPTL